MSIQREMILKHLQGGKSITAKEADSLFGCMRLGARIHELRTMGHDIRGDMEAGVNRLGHPTHYKRYWLAGGGQ